MIIGIIGVGFVGNAIYSFCKKHNIKNIIYDKYKNGGIGSPNDILNTDIVYLRLPTLFCEKRNSYNTDSIVENISFLNQNNYSGIILIKSTVQPTFSNNISLKYPKLKIWHNPEFLSAKTAVHDFENPPQIILGFSMKRKTFIQESNTLTQFYKNYFNNIPITIASSNETETVKICANSFYSVKIQFFNEIYDLCNKLHIDYNNVKQMMLDNKWINSNHTNVPGHDGLLSYGGACFPKDTNALLQFMKQYNVSHNVLEATIKERNLIRDK